MYRHWLLFRDHVTLCEDPADFEIEVVVAMDTSYIFDNRIFLATSDTETILFDSLEDHFVAAFIFDTENLLFDLCLPRDQSYLLVIRDEAGDGFADGTVEIYIDRVLVSRVSGNFGDLQVIEISSEGATVATAAPTQMPVTTAAPTLAPTLTPTSAPTLEPTESPTIVRVRATLPPILLRPQDPPTTGPTRGPTRGLTRGPTRGPSSGTTAPSVSLAFGVVVWLCALL